MRIYLYLTIAPCLFTAISTSAEYSVRGTEDSQQRTKICEQDATASLFAHFRRSANSVYVVSGTIVRGALELSSRRDSSSGILQPRPVSGGCTATISDAIEFTAVPTSFVSNQEDYPECETLLRDTASNPLTWRSIQVAKGERFEDLFLGISRGEGEIGTELYDRCPGACSPQYRVVLPLKGGASIGEINLYVVCGFPRDTRQNSYRLSTSFLCSAGHSAPFQFPP